MSRKNKYRTLFSPSGCITREAMTAFMDATLTLPEREAVEAHLETCLFCSEAMEGFEGAKGIASFEKSLAGLDVQIEEKLREKRAKPLVVLHPSAFSRRSVTIAIAASLALIAVFYFTLQQRQDTFFSALAVGARPVPGDIIPGVPQPAYYEEMTKPETKEFITAEEKSPAAVAVFNLSAPTVNYLTAPGMMGSSASYASPSYSGTNIVFIAESLNVVGEGFTLQADEAVPATDSEVQIADTKDLVATEQEESAIEIDGIKTQKRLSNISLNEATISSGKSVKRSVSTAEKVNSNESSDEVFTVVEQMPEFPGGNDSLNAYIGRNLQYPATAREAGVSGTVYLSFVVDEQGKIRQAKVERGLQKECDKEALRLVKSMPGWIAGRQNGKPVSVKYMLPVKFSL